MPGAFSPYDAAGAVAQLHDFIDNPHSRFGMGWEVDVACGQQGIGELALTVARSGVGKSTFFLNVIRNTPEVPTLVVNMEMAPRTQIQWLTAMTYDLATPGRDFEEVLRDPSDDRNPELRTALEKMVERYPDLHFVFPSRPTVEDIRVCIEDVADSTGVMPQRVFIDHLGLMGGAEKEFQGYIQLTSGLKALSHELNIAVNVLQQTGRRGGDGGVNDGHLPISMSSGRYGGEEDADWVFGLYRPEKNPKYLKHENEFDSYEKYLKMRQELTKVRGITVLQVVKNRIFSETLQNGLELQYDSHTRRYIELGIRPN